MISRLIVLVLLCIASHVGTCWAQEFKEPNNRPIPATCKPDQWNLETENVESIVEFVKIQENLIKRVDELVEEERSLFFTNSVSGKHEYRITSQRAREITNEFWRDLGDPRANYIYQDRLIHIIASMGRHAKQAGRAEIQEITDAALVEYCRNGGLGVVDHERISGMIITSCDLHNPEILDLIGALDDPHAAMYIDMIADADGSNPAGQKKDNMKEAGITESQTFEEQLAGDAPSLLSSDTTTAGKSSVEREEARRLLRDLSRWIRDGAADAGEIERIAKRAAGGFGDEITNKEVLRALLSAYRRVLQHKRQAEDDAIERAIDRDLIRIGGSSLCTKDVELYWARAVACTRERASVDLRKTLRTRLSANSDKRSLQFLRYAAEQIGLESKP